MRFFFELFFAGIFDQRESQEFVFFSVKKGKKNKKETKVL
jgi:hypothetical protein